MAPDYRPRLARALVLLATLAVVALTAMLGRWQLGRAQDKLARQALIDARVREPLLPADALARTPNDGASQLQRRITLHGRWLHAHTVFLDNRAQDGRVGFVVATPLVLAPNDAVLVQRGWVPRDERDRTRLPDVGTPAGDVTVMGRVVPWPSIYVALGADEPGAIRQNVALKPLAIEAGVQLRPVAIQQDAAAPQGEAAALVRHWPAAAVDVHKHYGYAVQWFLLGALAAGLYVWFQLIRPWRQRA